MTIQWFALLMMALGSFSALSFITWGRSVTSKWAKWQKVLLIITTGLFITGGASFIMLNSQKAKLAAADNYTSRSTEQHINSVKNPTTHYAPIVHIKGVPHVSLMITDLNVGISTVNIPLAAVHVKSTVKRPYLITNRYYYAKNKTTVFLMLDGTYVFKNYVVYVNHKDYQRITKAQKALAKTEKATTKQEPAKQPAA